LKLFYVNGDEIIALHRVDGALPLRNQRDGRPLELVWHRHLGRHERLEHQWPACRHGLLEGALCGRAESHLVRIDRVRDTLLKNDAHTYTGRGPGRGERENQNRLVRIERKAISLESTACATPSCSTTRTPNTGRGPGRGKRQYQNRLVRIWSQPISLESTACATPSCSTTRTPNTGRGPGRG